MKRRRKRKKGSALSLKKAKEYIFRLLGRRDYSEKKLKEKLEKKGYPSAIATEVIDYFRDKGFVDDEKFARRYVRARLASRPRGPRALNHELWKKGIDKPLRSEVIHRVYEEVSEGKLAERAFKKKYGNASFDRDNRRKAYQYLMRLGFSYEVIRLVLKKLCDKPARQSLSGSLPFGYWRRLPHRYNLLKRENPDE